MSIYRNTHVIHAVEGQQTNLQGNATHVEHEAPKSFVLQRYHEFGHEGYFSEDFP